MQIVFFYIWYTEILILIESLLFNIRDRFKAD